MALKGLTWRFRYPFF